MRTLKIHTEDKEQLRAVKAFLKARKIPFEVSRESPYDPEFVAKIKESESEAEPGTVKAIETDDPWR